MPVLEGEDLDQKEALLINAIACGLSSVNELCFELSCTIKEIALELDNLVKLELILQKNSSVSITKKGLLILSRYKFQKKCEKDVYTQVLIDDLPCLPYQSRFRKTTVFCPDLYYEFNFRDDSSFPIVYEVKLTDFVIDLDLLEIVNNLLYETDPYHPTGFWVLNKTGNSVCGYGIAALRKTLSIINSFKQITFIMGFKNFIIVARTEESQLNKISLKFYLTNGTFPYIDTLDWIYEKLKLFWVFSGLKDMPKGDEILINYSPYLSISNKPIHFLPSVLGRIYWTNKTDFDWTIPKILVYSPPTIDNNLRGLTPWFSTGNHGLLETDTDNKTKFGCFRYLFIKLPDVNIVTIILHTVRG